MCGLIGVIEEQRLESVPMVSSQRVMSEQSVSVDVFLGMMTLQHRGQDAAGILSYDESFHLVRNNGLVENVFDSEKLNELKGFMAIGHTRYSTVGTGSIHEVQPFLLNFPFGIGLAHNGNIVNYLQVKERLQNEMNRRCLTDSDSETILNWFAGVLSESVSKNKSKQKELSVTSIEEATRSVMASIHGAYSVVGLIAEAGLFAFRDPYGIRPLMLGKKNNRYMVASETIPFSFLGYEYVRDLMPGELLFIDQKMQIHSKRLEKKDPKPCMFEWVYFAGAEGEIESVAVYTARLALGRSLAEQIKEKIESGEIEADLVAPVPDTSRTAATALAESLQLPYREVLIKNRYIKRTFILNSKQKRERAVDLKLNPVVSQLKGKNIILVDDSIVRGTTSKKIIELVRRAGAKKVYFVSTCPPIRFPCFYGIDFPDQNELVAANRNAEEIALQLGADLVVYQNLPGLLKALEPPLASSQRFEPCLACLNGKYPTDVRESSRFTQLRNSERVKFEISESRSKPQASL